MLAYKTLDGNLEQLEELVNKLRKMKTNVGNVIKTSSVFDSEFDHKLNEIISELEEYKVKYATAGASLEQNAKWDK